MKTVTTCDKSCFSKNMAVSVKVGYQPNGYAIIGNIHNTFLKKRKKCNYG